jgi:hypothetical protein
LALRPGISLDLHKDIVHFGIHPVLGTLTMRWTESRRANVRTSPLSAQGAIQLTAVAAPRSRSLDLEILPTWNAVISASGPSASALCCCPN